MSCSPAISTKWLPGAEPASISTSNAALDLLCVHAWPGNIRELEREMARAALFLEDGELLQTRHLAPNIQDGSADAPTGSGLKDQLEHHERRILRAAARTLGIGRKTLYRRMKELGLSGFRSGHCRRRCC